MAKKKSSPKGFARVDSDKTNTHGWLVRICRGEERRSRFFSDSSHGGKAKAKKKAEECYQQWVEDMPAPGTTQDKLTKRNSSGVVGVHLANEVDSRYPDCRYVSYVASWLNDDGKRRNVRFLVNKYGKKVALGLATIARQHKLSDRNEVISLYEKTKGKIKVTSEKKNASAKPAAKKPAAKQPAAKPSKTAKKKAGTKKR